MLIELINTGSELMLGRVLNTHQQWLCRQLSDTGWIVARQVAVADTGLAIQQAVREGLSRADLVITTGGLGPTSDDITRELIAELLAKKLHQDPTALEQIRHFFEIRNRAMPEGTFRETMVPEGATVLYNAFGTAPGLVMEVSPNPFREGSRRSWLVMLPGPPRELRPMFTNSLVPLLKKVLPANEEFVCRTLRTTGIGESSVEERVAPPLQSLVNAGLDLGYCSRPGQVDIRLAARGPAANATVDEAETVVRQSLEKQIYGRDEEELEAVLVRLLIERKETVALAESCTGGLIAHRLTNVPGASAVLLSGWVTYSNEAKQRELGVDPETLAEHGAVSKPVARQMAEGARKNSGATYALAVTGIAGPGGGTDAKPVGTVFIGLAGPFPTIVVQNFNPWERETFKHATSQQAMELLRRKLLKLD
jgi:nicotinamide-nucleotide amidase